MIFSGGLATVKRKLDELGFRVDVIDEASAGGDYWWRGSQRERFWVEIRRNPKGLGSVLRCPLRDEAGNRNAWYELLDAVQGGDWIYHWNAGQERFVGRSIVASPRAIDPQTGERIVALRGFLPFTVDVGLERVRMLGDQLRGARGALRARHPVTNLYLPFQFRADGLRLMSNYFTKLPASMQRLLFGADGLAEDGLSDPPEEEGVPLPPAEQGHRGGFLRPFHQRADTDYVASVTGGRFKRGRTHETLVNDFASWLEVRGLAVASNAAIDLGLEQPPVIIEAKVVRPRAWAHAVREAVGQLYEYRYFQVVAPGSTLMFLASTDVPTRWLNYLDTDRRIAVAWRSKDGFTLSARARQALGV